MGLSRDERAKAAKAFLNKRLPAILKSNTRARKGVEHAELIVDPPPVSTKRDAGGSREPAGDGEHDENEEKSISIRLQVGDTLEAASRLVVPNPSKPHHKPRVAILNMASPLRPGGGVLTGATSQEEWLCARTSLYPSLREEFYRLPEVGGVYTPDVLVCKMWDDEALELKSQDQFFINVITAAMLRLPDVEEQRGVVVYAEQKDRDIVLQKMRAVMRILLSKGVERVVLGAWGCGAYANPVGEIARAWKRVLLGTKSKKTGQKESIDGLDIVFAIKDRRMALQFAEAFGPELVMENEDESLIAPHEPDEPSHPSGAE
ncbi:hypothetical protein PT974_10935 [Cladobotryum mycophilum]|uniref:Microbial-type PARG catalytic domain-containing protein n=1 Tax=Cladobotryum mycophilum TaxID=491253 RepID=A0ABR0SC43_9HYPO